jgi:hypothetical protein
VPTDSPAVVVLVRDLILGSRISAAAKATGVATTTVRDPARLASAGGDRLIVDLNLEGAILAAADWKAAQPGRHVLGFVSHVDVDTIKSARERGIDRVLARGRFVELLPTLLAADGLSPSDQGVTE